MLSWSVGTEVAECVALAFAAAAFLLLWFSHLSDMAFAPGSDLDCQNQSSDVKM